MNKLRFYRIAVVALLLSNVILLAFMFKGNKKRGNYNGPRKVIIKKLKLSDEQIVQYDKLIDEHKPAIAASHKEIRKLKNTLYQMLPQVPQDTVHIDSIQNRLSIVHAKMERIHYKHFLDIKALCTPEQMPAFEALSKKMAKLFATSKAPPPKGKK